MLSALWQRFLFWRASELGIRVVQSVLSSPDEWKPSGGYSVYHRENSKVGIEVEWAVNADHMPMEIKYNGKTLVANWADERLIRVAFKKGEIAVGRDRNKSAIDALKMHAERRVSLDARSPTARTWAITPPLPESADSGRG